jgi:hypothetical protein
MLKNPDGDETTVSNASIYSQTLIQLYYPPTSVAIQMYSQAF